MAGASDRIDLTVDVVTVGRADFDAFFRAEYPTLVSVAAALAGDRAMGEDIAAEAMSRAFQRWDTVGGYDKPGAWTRRVAINLATSRRRRLAREVRARIRLGARPDADTEAVSSDFARLIADLPARQRTAVVLRYVDDQPLADIAAAMGCAEGTVKAHLHAARTTLAERLTR